MTKRVLLDNAILRDGLYWYNAVLLTGVGFVRSEDRLVRACHIVDGRILGPYTSMCDIEGTSSIGVELKGEFGNYRDEPLIFDGKNYEGMGYEFDGEICVYEAYFENGEVESFVHWLPEGTMDLCQICRDASCEAAEWHGRGESLKSASIIKKDFSSTGLVYGCSISFLEDGSMDCLKLNGSILAVFAEAAGATRFFPSRSIDDIAKFKAAEDFLLIGDGVSGDFFSFLAHSGVLDKVQILRLFSVIITADYPQAITHLKNLREVEIEDRKGSQEGLALAIKEMQPGIKASYNKKDIS